MPPQQTVFEYLVGCWKRLNTARSAVMKKVVDVALFLPILSSDSSFGIRDTRLLKV
jgi:hypothetical protein